MKKNKEKMPVSRISRQIRRFYMILVLLGVLAAVVYFVVFPFVRKRQSTRITAGRSRRDAGATQIEKLQEEHAALTEDLEKRAAVLNVVTNRLIELEATYIEATNRVAELEEQLLKMGVKLDYEMNQNAVVETESVRQQKERMRAEAALKKAQAQIRGLERTLKKVETDQIDRAQYELALAEQQALSRKNSQQVLQLEQLETQRTALEKKLADQDRALARTPDAKDRKQMSKEMMHSVLAAQLRALDYDAPTWKRTMNDEC